MRERYRKALEPGQPFTDRLVDAMVAARDEEMERQRLALNGANAMKGVHKRRADNLRRQLDHAKAALAGDNDGIRAFMTDCEQRVERLKEQAELSARGEQNAEAEAERLQGEVERLRAELAETKAKIPTCNGMCLTAADVGVPVAGNPVARAHRSCPLHGDLEAVAWEQDAALRAADTQTERACKILTEVLVIWTEQRAYHQERAERKGYAHDEAAAEVYGAAIKVATDTIAVLNSPSGES